MIAPLLMGWMNYKRDYFDVIKDKTATVHRYFGQDAKKDTTKPAWLLGLRSSCPF